MRNLLLKPYKCSMSPYKNFLNIQIGVNYNKTQQPQATDNTLTQIVKNFYEKTVSQKEEEVPFSQISKTMKDVLKAKITPSDYFNFQPFTDELAILTGKLNLQNKNAYATSAQAKIMLQFGITFQIQDKEYWNYVLSSLEEQIPNIGFSETLGILTLLKQDKRLTPELTQKSIAHLKELLPSAVVEDLVSFVVLYVNPSVSQKLGERDASFEEKLEYYLIKRLETKALKSLDFSHLSRALSNQLQRFPFHAFFDHAVPFVHNWLKQSLLSIDQICFISQAYSNLPQNEKQLQLFLKMQESLINNCELIKLNEAVDLVQSMSEYASEDLMEILDRIIGHQIYEVHIEDLVPILKGFASNPHSRDKIVYLLAERIRQRLVDLSLANLIDYAIVLSTIKGDVDYYLETLEPYLLNKIDRFKEKDVVSLLKALNSNKLNKNYDIKDILEQMVLDNYLNYSFSTVIDLLHFYAVSRIGESVMVKSLLSRINNYELKNEEFVGKMSNQEFVKTIVTLNLCGESEYIGLVKDEIEKRVGELKVEELELVMKSLPDEVGGFEGVKNKINAKLSQK